MQSHEGEESDQNRRTRGDKKASAAGHPYRLPFRKPLTPVQRKTELGKVAQNVTGKWTQPCPASPAGRPAGQENQAAGEKPKPGPSTPSIDKAGAILEKFRKKVDSPIQTDNPDIDLITGATPPNDYWKGLAEERRVALEEMHKENQMLVERVESLVSENKALEKIVEDAKALAEMINSMADDDADESGIGKDEGDVTPILNINTSSTD